MTEKRREIIVSRDHFRANLVRHYKEIADEERFQVLDDFKVEQRRQIIKTDYDQLREYHRKVVCMTTDAERQVALNEEVDEVDEKYVEIMAIIDKRLRKPTGYQNQNQREPQVMKLVQQRVPEVGKFNGEPARWPAFRDLFLAEVHEKQDLDAVTKLIYLQRACVDKAKTTLGNWILTEENYEAAWGLMKEKYDDDFSVKQALLEELFALPIIRQETFDDLRLLVDTTNSCLRQLSVMGTPVDGWDDIVIKLLMKKLPFRTIDAFEQNRDSKDQPTLKKLLSLIDSRARGCNSFLRTTRKDNDKFTQKTDQNRENRFKPYTTQPPEKEKATGTIQTKQQREGAGQGKTNPANQTRPTNGPFRKNKPPEPCRQCGEMHKLWECTTFLHLELDEKRNMVRNWGLCFGCLSPSHTVGNCFRDICRDYKTGTHSFALCPKARRPFENAASRAPEKTKE